MRAAGPAIHSEATPIRRFVSIAALAALLIFPAPASAAPVAPTVEPPVQTSLTNSCQTSSGQNFFAGTHFAPPGNASGVSAQITTTTNGFAICNSHPFDALGNGAMAWVSIEPTSQSGCYESCIIQIGIIECAVSGYAACGGNGHPHYFWATAGCPGYWPKPWDLGVATDGTHTFNIYKADQSTWKFTIDNIVKATLNEDTNVRVNCWLPSRNLLTGFFGERWDLGDSLGSAAAALQFRYAKYGLFGKGWSSAAFSTGEECPTNLADQDCFFGGSDRFTVTNS